jgi:L-lactate dehydrogenase
LGVHGDSQVVAWSNAKIGSVHIDTMLPPDTFNHAELVNESKNRSQSIIQAKRATPFGIGSIVASICSSILFDKRNVRPVSHFDPGFGCCFSLPAVIGRKGIIRTIKMPLSDDEAANIAESAKALKATINQINEDR